jgi:hypothetical protein
MARLLQPQTVERARNASPFRPGKKAVSSGKHSTRRSSRTFSFRSNSQVPLLSSHAAQRRATARVISFGGVSFGRQRSAPRSRARWSRSSLM